LEIEAGAKRRLADEYDAAQERGEVATREGNLRRGPEVSKDNFGKATITDVGLSKEDLHEARIIRDAEEADPGIVRRTLDEALQAGEEPTRTKVKRAALATQPKNPGFKRFLTVVNCDARLVL
jgi:hypothetical protein